MRILDRYLLTQFIKNYVISLVVLIGLYVVLDMVFNFDEIVAHGASAGSGSVTGIWATLASVGDFYFYQTFLIFSQLSGIIPIAAAAFTLMRMSRFNELTAWLSAGVPMLRIAMPIILASVLFNGLVIIDQEILLPRMIPKLVRSHDQMHEDAASRFWIAGMQDDANNVLFASTYQPPGIKTVAQMWDIDILELDEQYQPTAHTRAAEGIWNETRQLWDLRGAVRVTGLRPDQVRSPETSRSVFQSSINPEEIALFRSSNFVNLLPTRRINELLQRPKRFGALNLLRVKHWRFTQPIMNVILLLLSIPAVLNHDPTQLKTAAMKCLSLTGLAMAVVFLSQQMAGHPPDNPAWLQTWPALMAWLPIFLFAPVSVWLLDRVRS